MLTDKMNELSEQIKQYLTEEISRLTNERIFDEITAEKMVVNIEEINNLDDPQMRYNAFNSLQNIYNDCFNRYQTEGIQAYDNMGNEINTLAQINSKEYLESLEGMAEDWTNYDEQNLNSFYDDFSEIKPEENALSQEVEVVDGGWGKITVSKEYIENLKENYSPESQKALLGSMATDKEVEDFTNAINHAKELGCPEDELIKFKADFENTNKFIDADAGVPQNTRAKIIDIINSESVKNNPNWEKATRKTRETLKDGIKLDHIESKNEKEIFKQDKKLTKGLNLASLGQGFGRFANAIASGDAEKVLIEMTSAFLGIIGKIIQQKRLAVQELANQISRAELGLDKATTRVTQQAKEIKSEELEASYKEMSKNLKELANKTLTTGKTQEIEFKDIDGKTSKISFELAINKHGVKTVDYRLNGEKYNGYKSIADKIMNTRTSSIKKAESMIKTATTDTLKKSAEATKSAISKTNPAMAIIEASKKLLDKGVEVSKNANVDRGDR